MENQEIQEIQEQQPKVYSLGGENKSNILVIGQLAEKDLIQEQYTKEDGTIGERIRGTVKVKCGQDEHALKVFVTNAPTKLTGKPSSSWENVSQFMDNHSSIAEVGEEKAVYIKVTGQRQEGNPYKTKSGQVVCFVENRGSFFTVVTKEKIDNSKNMEIGAYWATDAICQGIVEETKYDATTEENVPTGRYKGKFVTVTYGGKAFPFEAYLSEEGREYLESDGMGKTAPCGFRLVHRAEEVVSATPKRAGGFGKMPDMGATFTRFINEVHLTGMDTPYDDLFEDGVTDAQYNIFRKEELTKALALRKEAIDKAEHEEATTKTTTKAKTTPKGFGKVAQLEVTDDDDLPF